MKNMFDLFAYAFILLAVFAFILIALGGILTFIVYIAPYVALVVIMVLLYCAVTNQKILKEEDDERID